MRVTSYSLSFTFHYINGGMHGTIIEEVWGSQDAKNLVDRPKERLVFSLFTRSHLPNPLFYVFHYPGL